MFGRFKKWLGIEGVKIDIELDEVTPELTFDGNEKLQLTGHIYLHSKTAQSVTSIHLKLIERYSRGRRKGKLTDEYVLGEDVLGEIIEVPNDEIIEIPFTLPVLSVKSDMDKFQDKNVIFDNVGKLAKFVKGVKSSYYLVAEAEVLGTALNPFIKKEIVLHD